MSKRILIWLLVGAAPLLALVGAIVFFFNSLNRATQDVTDARQYQAILTELGYPKPTELNIPTIAHLPPTIPANATSIQFFYRPHCLQGGTLLQLRMILPPDELATIVKRLQPLAKQIRDGNTESTTQPRGEGLPDILFRDATNTTFAKLPEDFQTFILDVKESSVDNWYAYGVSISEKQSEVIYWLEDW